MKTFRNLLIMAIIGILGAGCAHEGIKKLTGKKGEAPITKPEIQLEGGRLTAEGLWAMGRIGSAQVDRKSGRIVYTVSY